MKRVLRFAVAALVSCVVAVPVMAQTNLDFNDLGLSSGGAHMPATYRDFAWATTDWHYLSSGFLPSNTYLALSGSATFIRRTDGAAFFFDGADFWSRRGLDAAGDFYFVLSYKGKTVFSDDSHAFWRGLLAERIAHPLTLTCKGSVRAVNHYKTREFYSTNDRSRFNAVPCRNPCHSL